MKAFISYSLNDQDNYILTLLSTELRNKGFVIRQSSDFHENMSALTKMNIKNSHLFIGLLSDNGAEFERVQREYNLSEAKGIPCIYLIEDTLSLNSINSPHITFSRRNPELAINTLKNKLQELRSKSKDANSNILVWMLGITAVLAVISLFSRDE